MRTLPPESRRRGRLFLRNDVMENLSHYTPEMLDHFQNPRNVGEIADADGMGMAGDPDCGDHVRIWIKIAEEKIAAIAFKCVGCPAAIATTSAFTELVKGMHVDDAVEVADEDVERALGGLPDAKRHCSLLAPEAFYGAVMAYVVRSTSGDDEKK